MLNTALIFMLAGGAAGGAIVAFDGLRRKRAAQRQSERLQELRIFARRRSLSALEDAVPDHVVERSTPRYARRRAEVEDVMLGRDERGNYYVLRRRHAGQARQLVAFDLVNDSHIDGLSVAPYERNRAQTLWQKLLRRDVESRQQVQCSWDCEARAMSDPNTIERVGKLIQLIARNTQSKSQISLALDVDGRRIAIRSQEPFAMDDLSTFLDAALSLREELLNTLSERVRGFSGEIRPIAEAVRSVAAQQSGRRTGEHPRIQDRDRSERDRQERQSGPWSTVMDIPPELLRKRDKTVDEPEEEVVVLTGRGTPI